MSVRIASKTNQSATITNHEISIWLLSLERATPTHYLGARMRSQLLAIWCIMHIPSSMTNMTIDSVETSSISVENNSCKKNGGHPYEREGEVTLSPRNTQTSGARTTILNLKTPKHLVLNIPHIFADVSSPELYAMKEK